METITATGNVELAIGDLTPVHTYGGRTIGRVLGRKQLGPELWRYTVQINPAPSGATS